MKQLLILCSICVLSAFVLPTSLTAQENANNASSPLRVVSIQDTALYDFDSSHDFMRLYLSTIAKYTGTSFEYIPAASKAEALTLLKDNKADVIPFIEHDNMNPESALYTLQSPFSFQVVIAAPHAIKKHNLRVGRNLQDMYVNTAYTTRFNPLASTFTYIDYPNRNALLAAMTTNEIDAILTLDAAIPEGYVTIAPIRPAHLYSAITHHNRTLLTQWNLATEQLLHSNSDVFTTIKKVCFPHLAVFTPELTKIQTDYIKQTPSLRIGICENRLPYTHFSKHEGFYGIAIDVLKLIEQNAGFTFTFVPFDCYDTAKEMLKQGDVDIITGAVEDGYYLDDDNAELAITKPYLSSSFSVVSAQPIDSRHKYDTLFVLEELNYLTKTDLLYTYDKTQIMHTTQECFKALKRNPNSIAIMTSLDAEFNSNYTRLNHLYTLPVRIPIKMCIMMTQKNVYPLCQILDIAISKIKADEVDTVTVNYIMHDYSKTTTYIRNHPLQILVYTLLTVILIVSIVFLAIIQHIRTKKNAEIMRIMHIANSDSMTGLLNRATFTSMVENSLTHMSEHPNTNETDMSVFIMIDVDNFKHVNDTYGHSSGDKVLMALANVLHSYFRRGDLTARMGGDEFAVFLPRVNDITALQHRMDGFVQAITLAFASKAEHIPATCSIGAAIIKRDSLPTTFTAVYNKADVALYKVKQNGKNSYNIIE